MKIIWHPRYDRSAASSRLRVFALHDAMLKYGIAESSLDPRTAAEADVAVNQKTDSITRGRALTVFDCDDKDFAGRAFGARPGLMTFDTHNRMSIENVFWNCAGSVVPTEVIPDCIDYEPTAPLPACEPVAATWFGNADNYRSSAWMFEAIKKDMPTLFIGEREQGGFTANAHWTYSRFPEVLRAGGLALLSHRGADQAKSENKMVAAITLGVPVIVGSGSPSYEALARACGLERFVCEDAADVKACAYLLREFGGERERYLAAAQPYIWEHYRSEVVARKAVEIYRAAAAARGFTI